MIELNTLNITSETLRAAVSKVDLTSVKSFYDYSIIFHKAKEVNEDLFDPLTFLAILCGWRLREDHQNSPFETVFGETAPLDDITESQSMAIAVMASEVVDTELRARLCDVVWMSTRSRDHACKSALAYISTIDNLIAKNRLVDVSGHVTRAIRIASEIRDTDLRDEICKRLVAISQYPDVNDSVVVDCLESLRGCKNVDPNQLYGIVTTRAQSTANFRWAIQLWELGFSFASQAKDEDRKNHATREIGQIHEREAENETKAFMAVHHLQNALNTFRKVAGADVDRNRVHQKLLKAQANLPGEMFEVDSGSVSIADIVTVSQARIRGKTKLRGLAELILGVRWPEKTRIQAEAEDSIRSFPLQHLAASVQLSSTGKYSAQASGCGPDHISADRLHAEMCRLYKFAIPIAVRGIIEPMCDELNLAHRITASDISFIVRTSPLVPEGRDHFFTLGILAGLQGRFVESLHILIPQLEHMLRCILEECGHPASSMNQAGIQQELDVNRLLYHPAMESILGTDLCFVMKVMLIERFGYNFRNELAHGMLTPTAFLSEKAIYIWWMIFHLVGHRSAVAILDQDGKTQPPIEEPKEID